MNGRTGAGEFNGTRYLLAYQLRTRRALSPLIYTFFLISYYYILFFVSQAKEKKESGKKLYR